MSGNVYEWVSDFYGRTYYENSPTQNPRGPATNLYRVVRGGNWNFDAQFARVSRRGYGASHVRFDILGFRLAGSPKSSVVIH